MSPTTIMRDDDTSEVDSNEYLIRWFASEPENRFSTSNYLRIAHLLPNKNDTDGLSLNRESFISAIDLRSKALNPRIRDFGGVLAVITRWLFDLGLSVKPDPSDIPGHVIVPEMNRTLYESSKQEEQRIKDLADKLIRLIAKHKTIRIEPSPIPLPN